VKLFAVFFERNPAATNEPPIWFANGSGAAKMHRKKEFPATPS